MKPWVYFTLLAVLGGGLLAAKHQFGGNHVAHEDSTEARAEAARLPERAELDNAETLVKMRLRNPDSVAFVTEKLVHVGRQEVVCGFAKSKNGSEGRTGHEHFAVAGPIVMLGSDGHDVLYRIEKVCGA